MKNYSTLQKIGIALLLSIVPVMSILWARSDIYNETDESERIGQYWLPASYEMATNLFVNESKMVKLLDVATAGFGNTAPNHDFIYFTNLFVNEHMILSLKKTSLTYYIKVGNLYLASGNIAISNSPPPAYTITKTDIATPGYVKWTVARSMPIINLGSCIIGILVGAMLDFLLFIFCITIRYLYLKQTGQLQPISNMT